MAGVATILRTATGASASVTMKDIDVKQVSVFVMLKGYVTVHLIFHRTNAITILPV